MDILVGTILVLANNIECASLDSPHKGSQVN